MEIHEKYITYRKDRGYYVVTIRTKEGSRIKSRSTHADTLEKAIVLRDNIISEMMVDPDILNPVARAQRVQKIVVPNVKVQKLLEQWVADDLKGRLAKGTEENALGHVMNYIVPVFAKYQLKDISYQFIQDWVDGLQKPGAGCRGADLTDKTIRNILGNMRKFLEYCVDAGYLLKNPANRVKIRDNRESKHRRAMTDKEWSDILEYANEHHHTMYLIFLLLYETDSRRGEVLALRWQDIELNLRLICIKNSLIRLAHGTEFVAHNKTHVEKVLPLSERMLDLLKVEREKQNRIRPVLETDFVFSPSEDHTKHYNASTVTAFFAKARKKKGLPDCLTLHCIRHTATTNLLKNGCDWATIKRIGGWKRVNTPIDIYSHLDVTDIKDKMESVLFNRK